MQTQNCINSGKAHLQFIQALNSWSETKTLYFTCKWRLPVLGGPDLADAGFLGQAADAADETERIAELLPAGLKHGALGRGHELGRIARPATPRHGRRGRAPPPTRGAHRGPRRGRAERCGRGRRGGGEGALRGGRRGWAGGRGASSGGGCRAGRAAAGGGGTGARGGRAGRRLLPGVVVPSPGAASPRAEPLSLAFQLAGSYAERFEPSPGSCRSCCLPIQKVVPLRLVR